VLGHKDTRQVKVYTKAANKRRMARSALASLIEEEQLRTTNLQTLVPDLQTGRQAIETKEDWNESGGSDGTRTRGLRRDRPAL
jgi:hypothetical protein